MNITIKENKKSNNKSSLYFYLSSPVDGKRKKYIGITVPTIPANEKERNEKRRGYRDAEKEKVKYLKELSGTGYKSEDFFGYADLFNESKKDSTKRINSSALMYLRRYNRGTGLLFSDITAEFIEGYKSYLLDKVKTQTTASAYLTVFKTILNDAARKGYISYDVIRAVRSIKRNETERFDYLTPDEFKQLIRTPFPENEGVRRAATFSGLTGLRKGDVLSLTTHNIISKAGEKYVRVYMEKVSRHIEIPLNDKAIEVIQDVPEGAELFPISKRQLEKSILMRWLLDAGLDTVKHKHFTFHSFRHTFAVMLLTATNNIFLVSKLLGHSNINTTMRYSHLLDDDKVSAIKKL